MKHPVPSLVSMLTTDSDKKFEAVAHMADVIVDVVADRGHCQPQDLYAKGFTHQNINADWHFAEALAQAEMRCNIDQHSAARMSRA